MGLENSCLFVFKVVRNKTGDCNETMHRKSWDVQDLNGKYARVRLIDYSSSRWGHINFDDLKGDIICDKDEGLDVVQSEKYKDMTGHHSYTHNLSSCEIKA